MLRDEQIAVSSVQPHQASCFQISYISTLLEFLILFWIFEFCVFMIKIQKFKSVLICKVSVWFVCVNCDCNHNQNRRNKQETVKLATSAWAKSSNNYVLRQVFKEWRYMARMNHFVPKHKYLRLANWHVRFQFKLLKKKKTNQLRQQWFNLLNFVFTICWKQLDFVDDFRNGTTGSKCPRGVLHERFQDWKLFSMQETAKRYFRMQRLKLLFSTWKNHSRDSKHLRQVFSFCGWGQLSVATSVSPNLIARLNQHN